MTAAAANSGANPSAATSGRRHMWVQRILLVTLLVLALAGTAIAAYLAWENSQGKSGVCTIAHGCDTVQKSKYGKILGVPVSIPGLGLYLALVAAAAIALVDFRGWRAYATLLGFYAALGGFAFSVYLTYLEAYVIDAWCIYCITSALLLTALLIGWSWRLADELRSRRAPA